MRFGFANGASSLVDNNIDLLPLQGDRLPIIFSRVSAVTNGIDAWITRNNKSGRSVRPPSWPPAYSPLFPLTIENIILQALLHSPALIDLIGKYESPRLRAKAHLYPLSLQQTDRCYAVRMLRALRRPAPTAPHWADRLQCGKQRSSHAQSSSR